MDKKSLRIPIAILIFFIFFVNWAAMKFYWYSALPWFDMPMHFLGGFWVALLFAFILLHHWRLPKSTESRESPPAPKEPFSIYFALQVIGGVLLVGILWEFFEVSVNNITVKEYFDIADTVSDLIFDLAGSLLALLFLYKKSKL